jgi:hypothetical protein
LTDFTNTKSYILMKCCEYSYTNSL